MTDWPFVVSLNSLVNSFVIFQNKLRIGWKALSYPLDCSLTASHRSLMPTVTNISTYKFAALSDLKPLRERLIAQCLDWGLKGTILLSTEGINLFVAGPRAEIDWLVAELRAIPGLEGLSPKFSLSDQQPFTRMLVRIKKEIIAFGVEGIDPARRTSPKLPARELKRWLDEGRPVTLLDTRNDYEVKLGTFKNALPANISQFRDFPDAVSKLPEELKQQLGEFLHKANLLLLHTLYLAWKIKKRRRELT